MKTSLHPAPAFAHPLVAMVLAAMTLILTGIFGQAHADALYRPPDMEKDIFNPEEDKRGLSEEERCAIDDLWELFQATYSSINPLERERCDALAKQPLPPEILRAEFEIALAFMEGWNNSDWGPFSNRELHSPSGRLGIPGGIPDGF